MRLGKVSLLVLLNLLIAIPLFSQQNRKAVQRCATMQVLEDQFKRNPEFRTRFAAQEQAFQRVMRNRQINSQLNLSVQATYTIPIVFHVVLGPNVTVTDAQILAQLDTLNHAFAGINGDSTKIPSYFKPFFGKSQLSFCLAQQNPEGEPTNGITRTITNRTSFGTNDDVKYTSKGGTDVWDPARYLNVWLCILSDDVLGYSSFPDDDAPSGQGVVIDYRCLPGGSFTGYNKGKTMVHEVGHYFNLYHIWGDDNGACTGTDFVDDTPNQADATTTCPSGIITDACTTGGNGIMYQDYMDYSGDECLVMYTNMQVDRMHSALNVYRESLLFSNGCVAPVLKNLDALLKSIVEPKTRVCGGTVQPVVTIRNKGLQPITSLKILSRLDSGTVTEFNWQGNLASLTSENVTLNSFTVPTGEHTLTIYISNPNAQADEDPSNDTLQVELQYNLPVNPPITEGFESTTFPPPGWDIVNPDDAITWERATVGKSSKASAMINNFDYRNTDQRDFLRMPEVNLSGVDSVFLTFQVAAAVYTRVGTANTIWDTLQVMVSTNCGQTYTSVYSKSGSDLITRTSPVTNAFIPRSSEWRKDSVDLSAYANTPNLMIAFVNTTEYENNIYLDDVNLRTVSVNPNLKAKGFMVTPNPTSGVIAVQFYPKPTGLKAIQLFNFSGQKIAEVSVGNGQPSNYYRFDLSKYSSGIYVVRAVFDDKVLTQKIMKN